MSRLALQQRYLIARRDTVRREIVAGGDVIVDTGLIEGAATFDNATGDFLSFKIIKLAGPRPGACSAILAART